MEDQTFKEVEKPRACQAYLRSIHFGTTIRSPSCLLENPAQLLFCSVGHYYQVTWSAGQRVSCSAGQPASWPAVLTCMPVVGWQEGRRWTTVDPQCLPPGGGGTHTLQRPPPPPRSPVTCPPEATGESNHWEICRKKALPEAERTQKLSQ